ncbi:MAG: hypothetical protein IJZ75_03880 [Clostridia bacterium]|nr:hypothetical protein [Clostridia bacterium]
MNFRYKLMEFMRGRYGLDNMFYVIFAVAAALAFINCFIRSFVLQMIVYALGVYAFFRVLSRNTEARARENRRVNEIINRAKKRMDTARQRKADTTHIYKKCPHCRATLRLPRTKGKHSTVCPRCNKKFSVRVFREIK